MYEPSTLASISQPIVDVMSLAFFRVYLIKQPLYGILLIPEIADLLDSHIALQICIQIHESPICLPQECRCEISIK